MHDEANAAINECEGRGGCKSLRKKLAISVSPHGVLSTVMGIISDSIMLARMQRNKPESAQRQLRHFNAVGDL